MLLGALGGGGMLLVERSRCERGVQVWFVSEDEINSGVGLFIARSKRVPCTRDANVNKFKSKERATILGGSRVWHVLFQLDDSF